MLKSKWLTGPYLVWMTVFIVIPLILTGYYAFTRQTPDGLIFTVDGFRRAFEPMHLTVFWNSFRVAIVSTGLCLLFGYPVAYILTSKGFSQKTSLILLFAVPMWMNFLLRTYAWLTILERNGVLNRILYTLGLPPIHILYTGTAVMLGMVYSFLPFMILPIYTALTKIDYSLVESAQDLGANPLKVFTRVIFPLSVPGVISGITMVFMPSMTVFIIPMLLGGGQYMLIGNLIERQFLSAYDWNFGASLSFILMVIIFISMAFISRVDKESTRGTLLK